MSTTPTTALTNGSAHFQDGQPCDGTEVYQNFTDNNDGLNNHDHTELQIQRQGGSSSNWSSTGTSNYANNVDWMMQMGSIATAGGASNIATVTFPTAFGNLPLVFTSIKSADDVLINVTAVSSTQATLQVNPDADTTARIAYWVAYGPTS